MKPLALLLLGCATVASAQGFEGQGDAGVVLLAPVPDAGAPLADEVPLLGLSLAGVSLTVQGYAQVDVVPFSQAAVNELNPSTGAPLNDVGISLRRAHVLLTASRWIFSASGELEATSTPSLALRLFAAEVAVRWPEEGAVPLARLSAGLVRIPFGRDVPEDALRRTFLERPAWAEALFPGALDLGVVLSGGWRFVRYQAAVMNGAPAGQKALAGQAPLAAKDVLGRVGVDTKLGEVARLWGGFSALTGTGFHPGTAPTKETLVWRDANEDGQVQATELQVIGGLPGTASAGFAHFALGADLRVELQVPVLGALTASGELVWGKNLDRGLYVADPVVTGRDARELGWAVSLSQALPLGFLVGARYDVYAPDLDASLQQPTRLIPVDASLRTLSVLASWRWKRTARVMVQYEHQRNALGIGADGAPTTLPSDRLTVRLEVAL